MALHLAAPFFSYSEPLLDCLNRGATIKLIVRLGPATNADELEKIRKHPNAFVRFYTSEGFHSKIYIFGEEVAIVGSANLTNSGMNSNSEACITVDATNPDFEEVCSLFSKYWADAKVYDEWAAKKYSQAWRTHGKPPDPLVEAVRREFGNSAPPSIGVGLTPPPKDRLFVDGYKRRYQTFLSAFLHLSARYARAGFRRVPETTIPLRIEIDQFLSWVRHEHASDERIATAEFKLGSALDDHVDQLIQQWRTAARPYLFDTIPGNYRRIVESLGSKEVLAGADATTILDALQTCHAFDEQRRFHLGGLPTLRGTFIKDNGIRKIKETLDHLLFGPGDDTERLADSIYNHHYKLRHFGRSCAQELIGWVGKNELPVWNGRTSKSLRYLGYDVEMIG